MLDSAIQDFLNERKALWLKKKISPSTSDEDKITLEQEANTVFTLAAWLPDAAKRAKQLSLVSHPGKFTHPSAKTTPIIATAPRKVDGYLRSGNVAVDLDVFGNAAAMDVYKFLSITLSDGQTVLQHLEQATETITMQFKLPDIAFDTLRTELLAIKQSDTEQTQTSGLVKQVYFPVNAQANEYHLLSILSSSGMMYQLKERLNRMRFADEVKVAREARKKNQVYEGGFSDIPGLAAIGFGGTKPQNISVLNSKHGGVANLLPSLPPLLDKKRFSPPARDFFAQSLYQKAFADDLQAIHKQLSHDVNNIHVRRKIDWLIKQIIYQVIDQAWRVRRLDAGWSQAERCQALPLYQKIWLDQHYIAERAKDMKWLDKVKTEIARWFIETYKKLLADDAIQWDDQLLRNLKNIVAECEDALQ